MDLENHSSVGGRIRHINTLQNDLNDLKEEGYLVVNWISGEANETDIFTRNSAGPVFDGHIGVYCGY